MTYRENSIELATNNLSISPAENARRNREVYLNILKEEKKQAKIKLKKEKEDLKKLSLEDIEEVQKDFQHYLNEINALSKNGHKYVDCMLSSQNTLFSKEDGDSWVPNPENGIFNFIAFIILVFTIIIFVAIDEIINFVTFGNLTISGIFLDKKSKALIKTFKKAGFKVNSKVRYIYDDKIRVKW